MLLANEYYKDTFKHSKPFLRHFVYSVYRPIKINIDTCSYTIAKLCNFFLFKAIASTPILLVAQSTGPTL